MVEEVLGVVGAPQRERLVDKVLPRRHGPGEQAARPLAHERGDLVEGARGEAERPQRVGDREVEVLARVDERAVEIEDRDLHSLFAPSRSSTMTNSTRRFLARPSAVSLVAMGREKP